MSKPPTVHYGYHDYEVRWAWETAETRRAARAASRRHLVLQLTFAAAAVALAFLLFGCRSAPAERTTAERDRAPRNADAPNGGTLTPWEIGPQDDTDTASDEPTQTQPGARTWRDEARETQRRGIEALRRVPVPVPDQFRAVEAELLGGNIEALWLTQRSGMAQLGRVDEALREPFLAVLQELGRRKAGRE